MNHRHDARAIALDLLDRLDTSPLTLDRLVEAALDDRPELPQRDRSLVFALVYGVQRWRSRLDRIATHFAARPWSRIDPPVRNILRLALFQLLFLDRIPAPAAVHTAVELAKGRAPKAANFVNGLLRRCLREGMTCALDPPADNPAAALALETAFPPWLTARWISRDGLATARLRCQAANRIPPLTVRVNRLQNDRETLFGVWRQNGLNVSATAVSPDGIVISAFQGPVHQLPGYSRGWFQVQDEAAQLVGMLVAPAPGMRILDACAGRGGKTGHLAALAADRAEVLATDSDHRKLADLSAEMHRLAIRGVKSETVDWLAAGRDQAGESFDTVLIDAPCSGLGVIARNPDIKWRRQQKDLKRHGERQLALAAALADRVKPGGAMVYAVCSIEPEETEAVIDAFLRQRTDFTVQPPETFLPSAVHRAAAGGRVKLDPAFFPMDGFFMVRLVRSSSSPATAP